MSSGYDEWLPSISIHAVSSVHNTVFTPHLAHPLQNSNYNSSWASISCTKLINHQRSSFKSFLKGLGELCRDTDKSPLFLMIVAPQKVLGLAHKTNKLCHCGVLEPAKNVSIRLSNLYILQFRVYY